MILKHRAILILLLALTAVCMAGIFALSAQTAPESDGLSKTVAEHIAKTADKVAPPPAALRIKSYFVNNKVREWAHFLLFFLLGGISAAALYTLMNRRFVVPTVLGAVFCLGWAVLDEVHQIFVPGRGCELSDVMTDMCGALLALSLVAAARAGMLRRRRGM